jgi:hypothetical protein
MYWGSSKPESEGKGHRLRLNTDWNEVKALGPRQWTCGHCGTHTSSREGYRTLSSGEGEIRMCSSCNRPTAFLRDEQIPGAPFGEDVKHLPKDLEALYEEARRCMTIQAYSAAILLCRKILMHVAVSKGAKEGETFVEYVGFLFDRHFVPPDGKEWVDKIRTKGNEATHEIKLMDKDDAEDLLTFTGTLLRVTHEFPARAKKRTEEEQRRKNSW